MTQVLQEFYPPSWAKHLRCIPKWKIQLANPSTPIHEWKLAGVPAGFSVAIKRDDMTGSTLSGNKVYKLEFLMAEALSRNCKHVITCGAIQSNHCRAVAVCARQLGMTPHINLLTQATDRTEPVGVGCEGNLLLDRMCASEIYLSPWRDDIVEIDTRMEKIAEHIKETTGESAYVIPQGGSNIVGTWGYITAFEELIKQGVLDRFDDIVFACGSGGTAAGLAIGNYLTGSRLRLHGIIVCQYVSFFYDFVNEILESVGIDARAEDIVNIIGDHVGEGYGIASQEIIDLIISVSSTTGIILDPVYTGKAVQGMLHQLNHNPGIFKGKRILYLHTGGVFSLYDGRLDNTLKLSAAKTNDIKVWTNIETPPF